MPSLHEFFNISLLLTTVILLLFNRAMAQDDPPNGFCGTERDALLALRDEFNNSFLNENWASLMCYLNDPPPWYGIQYSNGHVTGIVLENLGLTGKVKADAFLNLTMLSILSLKNNSISGNVMDLSHNQKLTQINFSGNKFDGPISVSLLSLNFLESLQLQDNRLTGSIPEFNQSTLRQFNVSNNQLSGPIPNTVSLQSLNSSSFSGNPGLCGLPSPIACNNINKTLNNDTSNSDEHKHDLTTSTFTKSIFIAIDIVGLVVIVLLVFLYCKKSRKLKEEKKKSGAQEVLVDYDSINNDNKIIEAKEKRVIEGDQEKGKLTFMDVQEGFELGDLLKASAEGLGKGNFGNCYKAILDGGPAVVVKRLRDLKPLTSDEFAKQLQVIADQKHPNLLPLIAYYYSKDEKLLVYKFASNGNVYTRLHEGRGTKHRIPFRWSSRLSAARGVARALEHLHLNTKSQTLVPHGNLKSTNVLLDENEMPLVSDYGLTSLIALPILAQRMVSYKSPEYQGYKKVSKKSDVWSYGGFLLELLTGKVSTHSAPRGLNGVDLCNWVHRAVREEWTAEIFDLEIGVQRSANHGMLKLLQLAIRCCDKLPEKRPEMMEVVRELETVKVIDSSEDEDDLSLDPSLTDDSISATTSVISGEDQR